MLKSCVDMEKGGKYYKIAESSSNLMMFLVNDILDFSQIEARKLVLNLEDGLSILQVIRDSVELLSFKAESKNLSLSYTVDSDFPDSITTDANRLK